MCRVSDLPDLNIGHAAVVAEAADRLVAGPAGDFAGGLDRRRDRIERRPVPRAGRAEDAHRRGADGGGDMQQAGIVRHGGLRGGERQNGVPVVFIEDQKGKVIRRIPETELSMLDLTEKDNEKGSLLNKSL